MKIQNKKIELRKEKESTENKRCCRCKRIVIFLLESFYLFCFSFFISKNAFSCDNKRKKNVTIEKCSIVINKT